MYLILENKKEIYKILVHFKKYENLCCRERQQNSQVHHFIKPNQMNSGSHIANCGLYNLPKDTWIPGAGKQMLTSFMEQQNH